jgi:transposase
MQAVTTIALDIAKSVFQVHGIDAEDNVLIRRRLKRRTHGCTDQRRDVTF